MLEKIGYTLIILILISVTLQISMPIEENRNLEANTTYIQQESTHENTLTKQDIEEALVLVTERIKQDTKEDGTFNYIYYPSDKSYSDSYNMIRHILAVDTLIEFYKTSGDETYIEYAEKGISFFLEYLIEEEHMSYITYEERTKLGAAATAVFTLINYQETTDTTTYDNIIEDLGEFIIYMQNEDGGYNNYYPDPNPDNRLATVLYTGESDLALIRLYKYTGEQKYFHALEASYNWVESYFDERHAPALVSWTSSAFAETYYETGDTKYADLAFEMTDWLINKTQYTEENAPSEDYIGSFIINDVENGLTCTVAAYGEGITDMIKLSQAMKDTQHEEKYTESLDSALTFMLEMQYTDNSDKNAQGAFKASMYKNHFRIDFNTHAAITLIRAIENKVY